MKHLIFILTGLALMACSEKDNSNDLDNDVTDTNNVNDDNNDDIYNNVIDLPEVLNHPSGCADFVFFDRNDEDSLSLEVSGSGLAEATHSAGEPMSYSYDLSDLPDDIVVEHLTGLNLTHDICNDAIDSNIETEIDSVFIPVSGTLTLTVTPTGEATDWGEYPAEIEVNIQMADFCMDIGNGDTHHENCLNVDSYTADAMIGWLPG